MSNANSYFVFSKEIEKSKNDNRSYRIIRLCNDLEALLIHDSNTDKAAASLDINIGSFLDPVINSNSYIVIITLNSSKSIF